MSVPVRINDDLVKGAKRQADRKGRSISSQIEYWANLGKVLEKSLTGEELDRVLDGFKVTIEPNNKLNMASIREKVKKSNSRISSLTEAGEWYIAAPGRKGYVIRITAKGERTVGRFKHGEFTPERK